MTNKNCELLHEKLTQDLSYLKLPKIREVYQDTIDMATKKDFSMLQLVSTLFGEETAARKQRAILARLKRAKLPQAKTLDSFDFSFPSRIPKQKILRLFDCDFVSGNHNAVFFGPSGTGKTHLMSALGYTAIQKGISVRFARVVDMINDLSSAQANGTLARAIRSYIKPSILLCDELGYLPVDKQGADLFFQVVSARYEQGSIIITTNRPFKDWGTLFNADNTVATAMIDRLMHHGEVFVFRGKSYRMKDKNPENHS
ncbi:MAG: transposase [Thermodesulfobacteriota bacterium]|nr:MAG: transposase [Thermodesulfobacteriota bacterium]